MFNMKPKLVGFFPKKNDYNNPFQNDGIIEIGSVSDCIRKGLDDWINLWKHNEIGFYNSEAIIRDVTNLDFDKYTIFGYKLFLFCYEKGKVKTKSNTIALASNINIAEDLSSYDLIGFDIANISPNGLYFECSALSCNKGYKEYRVNKFCLLDDLNYALTAIKEISAGNYEPGEQYLLEVYKKKHS